MDVSGTELEDAIDLRKVLGF